jgi:hypothetical protein
MTFKSILNRFLQFLNSLKFIKVEKKSRIAKYLLRVKTLNKFVLPPMMQFLWHMLTPCKVEFGFSAQSVTHNVESMVHIASQVGRAETH